MMIMQSKWRGVVRGWVVREKIAPYVGVASSSDHRIMRHNIPYIRSYKYNIRLRIYTRSYIYYELFIKGLMRRDVGDTSIHKTLCVYNMLRDNHRLPILGIKYLLFLSKCINYDCFVITHYTRVRSRGCLWKQRNRRGNAQWHARYKIIIYTYTDITIFCWA